LPTIIEFAIASPDPNALPNLLYNILKTVTAAINSGDYEDAIKDVKSNAHTGSEVIKIQLRENLS